MAKSYPRIFSYFKPYIPHVLATLIFNVMVIGAVVTVPEILKDLVDDALKMKDLQLLTRLILFGVGLVLIKEIATYFQIYLISYAGQRAVADLRKDFFGHLTRLSLSFYTRWHTGELVTRAIQDVHIIRETFVENFIVSLPSFFIFIGLLIKILSLNPKLTLIICLLIPIIGYLLISFGKRGRRESKRLQGQIDNLSAQTHEVIGGIRTVISFCRERYERGRFDRTSEDVARIAIFRSKLRALQEVVVEFITVLGLLGVFWIAFNQIIGGKITPGELTAFFACLVLIAEPLRQISRSYFSWQQAAASWDRIFEVMQIKEEVEERDDAKIMPQVEGGVEFAGVSFSYGEREILKEIDFGVKPGETVAIVGRSGVGKTTLLNLIPRFYDPTRGIIKIDAHDICDFKLPSLRAQIGIVQQEPILFSGTLRSNILYGNLEASDEKVIEAARAANIHEFILSLKDGYETEVGEMGAKLSVGERQRITIARAILKNPRIIILDEPTSSLDSESETLVNEALSKLMESKTAFIIAHRLSTVIHADRLIVLDAGRIVEMGTHQELLDKNGLYASLFAAQLFV